MAELMAVDARERTAKLAYQLWEKRGRPFSSPQAEWVAPEEALASAQRDPKLDLHLYGIALSKRGTV